MLFANKNGNIFHKILRQRCVRALTLCLPLFLAFCGDAALAQNPHGFASARHHTTHVAGLARPAAHVRPHRLSVATYARRYGFRSAATAPRLWVAKERPHVQPLGLRRRFASAHRRLVAFVAARPTLRSAQASGIGSSVIADALRFIGAGNVTGTRGPWCADYASMILRQTGHRPLAGRSVSAAFAYGPRVRQPKPGDLVVLNTRAGFAQHVGFFAGWSHGQMVMVSGNWGHRVSVAPISARAVAAFIGV